MIPSMIDLLRLPLEAAELINNFIRNIPLTPDTVHTMTYRDAIGYFVRETPADTRVKKGAILRQHHPAGYVFLQMFLDKNNDIVVKGDGTPYGRKLIVKNMDLELMGLFGEKVSIPVDISSKSPTDTSPRAERASR